MGGGLGSDMLRMNYSAIHNGGGNGIGTSESISTMIGLGGMGTMGINGGGKDNPGDSPLPHSMRVFLVLMHPRSLKCGTLGLFFRESDAGLF